MRLSDFDYQLPTELIAQKPLERRDASRMLVLNRKTRTFEDSRFESFPYYVRPNDVVVVNNTRVFPARLVGRRDPSGGRVEVLLVRQLQASTDGDNESKEGTWTALARPAHRLKVGDFISFGNSSLRATVLEHLEGGMLQLKLEGDQPLESIISEVGQTPLPPYIKRPSGTSLEDRERYQTVFARPRGAIAAPTAGLHFTSELNERILSRGALAEITLHVGYGTFEPVRVENVEDHQVAPEFFQITEDAARVINTCRETGGRVIAVGTTTSRALESSVDANGLVQPVEEDTGLTITPGYNFRVTDALLTNFHLPQSSLLLLVCAFAGREFTLDAYKYAVEQRFRFYSFGDCMFVI